MPFLWKVRGVLLAASVIAGQVGLAQTAKPKPATKPTTKPGMAAWSPEVQKTLGVSEANFTAEGLNRLTQAQLSALLISARPDPRKGLLTCPASGTMPAGRIKIFVTVAGDDSTGAIATAIRQSVGSLSGVDVVDSAAAGRPCSTRRHSGADDQQEDDWVYGFLSHVNSMQRGDGGQEDGCGTEGNPWHLHRCERTRPGQGFSGNARSGVAATANEVASSRPF